VQLSTEVDKSVQQGKQKNTGGYELKGVLLKKKRNPRDIMPYIYFFAFHPMSPRKTI